MDLYPRQVIVDLLDVLLVGTLEISSLPDPTTVSYMSDLLLPSKSLYIVVDLEVIHYIASPFFPLQRILCGFLIL